MKLRTTLLVLLLGIAAFVAIKLMGAPPQAPEAHPPLVPAGVLDNWDEIELKLFSDERLKVVREPGAIVVRFGQETPDAPPFAWRDPADLDRVEQLLRALKDCSRDALQGGADDLLRMGLDPPRCEVVVRGKGGEFRVGFGNEDPTGHGILARSGSEVFRTGAQVFSVLKGFNLDGWRSRTVFGFDPLAVSEIDVTRFDPKDPKNFHAIAAVRDGGSRNWRLTQPRSLMADGQACANLAQQLSVMKVQHFVAQQWKDEVRKITGLPDQPFLTVAVSSGPSTLVLDVGNYIPSLGYAAVLHQRGDSVCFTLAKEEIEALIALTPDALRVHRLFPRIEATLVGLKKSSADGQQVAWDFARQADHPRGKWEVRQPFQALANDGKGSGSFAQAVVDLDRVEITEYLDPGTPFTPECQLELRVKNDPLIVPYRLEVARVGGRTLVRDPKQQGELFAVGGNLGAILDLDPQLFRDRLIFPSGKDYAAKLIRWRLASPKGTVFEVRRGEKDPSPVAAPGTPDELVPKLTAAASEFLGNACSGYVRRAAVPGEPFAHEVLRLTLATREGEETLVVGAEGAEGFYCRVDGRLPEDVLMIVPRGLLTRLFELLP